MMLKSLVFSAVAVNQDSTFSELSKFSLAGSLVVFFVLGLLAIFCGGIGYIFQTISRQRVPQTISPIADTEDDEEIVAVIAAAVAEVLAVPHRIVYIRGLTSGDMERALGGRFQHHISHNLPRRGRTPP